MSYLEQLRQQDDKKKIRGGGLPPKPAQPGFDGSVGTPPPPVGSCEARERSSSVLPASARKVRRAAQEATWLQDFREALVLGRLHICANCERFSFAAEPAETGNCRQHGETWPFVPFDCRDFALTAQPAARAYSPASPFVLDTPEEWRR